MTNRKTVGMVGVVRVIVAVLIACAIPVYLSMFKVVRQSTAVAQEAGRGAPGSMGERMIRAEEAQARALTRIAIQLERSGRECRR